MKENLMKMIIPFFVGIAVALSFSSYEKHEKTKIEREEKIKIETQFKEKDELILKIKNEYSFKISSLEQKLKREQYKNKIDKDKYIKIIKNADGSSITEITDKSKIQNEKTSEENSLNQNNNESTQKTDVDKKQYTEKEKSEKTDISTKEKIEIEKSEKRGANWLIFFLGLGLGAFGVPLL